MSCTILISALNQLISLWSTFWHKWHNHEGRPFQCAYARSHATKIHSATQLDTWRGRESSNALNGVSIFCNRLTKNEATGTGHSFIHSQLLSCIFLFSVNVSISSRAPLPFCLSLWLTITTHTLTKTETNLFFKSSVFLCFDFFLRMSNIQISWLLELKRQVNYTTLHNILQLFK